MQHQRSKGVLGKRYPVFAREALPVLWLLIALVIVFATTIGLLASLPVAIVLGFALYLFRDPPRDARYRPLDIISPIEGCVTSVQISRDNWLDRAAACIEIDMSFTDVYAVYAPIEGKLVERWSAPKTDSDAHSARKIATLIRTDEDDDVVLELRRHLLSGPVVFNHPPGERIGHGRRFAFAYFGCVATIYLPANSQINVEPGQSVTARSSVLANLVHESAVNKAFVDNAG